MARVIRPKNWLEFQHYKDRSPIWIKLHRKLLDDYDFQSLPVASRALAPMLWLLASDYEGGEIPGDTRKIAFRLRMTLEELSMAFEPLLKHGFFEIIGADSEVLAEPERDAIPEKEIQVTSKTQVKTESICAPQAATPIKRKTRLPDKFPFEANFLAAKNYWLGKGRADLPEHISDIAETFRDHHTSNGTTSEDWSASWRTWYRNAVKFNKPELKNGRTQQQGRGIRDAADSALEAIERATGKNPNGGTIIPPSLAHSPERASASQGNAGGNHRAFEAIGRDLRIAKHDPRGTLIEICPIREIPGPSPGIEDSQGLRQVDHGN